MPTSTEAFIARLAHAVPELEPLRVEHLAYYEELLPHLLAADVARHATQTYARDGAAAVRPMLAALEAEAGHDPAVDEVLAASFLEALPYPGEIGHEVVTLLGPRLAVMLARQRG
jgi:hypothetical protein